MLNGDRALVCEVENDYMATLDATQVCVEK